MNPVLSRWRHLAARHNCAALALILLTVTTAGTTRSQTHSPVKPAKTVQTAPQSKGIWEPINYPDDVHLGSVFFVNDQVGWVGGKGTGGFLLHTTDAGNHWDMQLGDPHSNTGEVWGVQFIDATHGWAVQDGQLMRTTDGQHWETIGPFVPNQPVSAYRFTSVRDGFEIAGYYSGSAVYATHDGGRNWKKVFDCTVTLLFNGLTHNVSCYLRDLNFVTPQVGYAVGGGFNDPWATIIKTVDGGATWKVAFATTDFESVSAVFFTDENNGIIRLKDHRMFLTSDGGQSWRGAVGSGEASIKLADPQVGWSCTDIRCSTTLDGGQSWTSRSNPFPEDIADYTVPRRDRLFVVGPHGMIYRYRVVPGDYNAKGILDAPLMPTYGGPIVGQLQQMQTQVVALQSALSSAPSTTASSASNAPAAASFASSPASAPAPASSSSGGFSQDTSGAGTFAQSTAAAPSSQFVQGCCSSQVQGLQSSFSGVAQQVPQFTGQFRNLNVLFVGLNMYQDLTSRAKQMRDAFLALKQSPDAASALAALVTLTTDIQGASQAVTTQFQGLTSGAGMGSASTVYQSSAVSSSASGPQNQTAAAGTQNQNAVTPPPAASNGAQPGSADSTANHAANAAQNAAQNAAKAAVSKVVPKLPF